ncbi:MAG TPA: 3-deoxy-7-phosphoheptulonate synthase class II [Kofleriaceae bacterium]
MTAQRGDWSTSSWRSRPAQQQPTYPDEDALRVALAHIARLPPLVTSGEVELLKEQLAEAAVGERFIIQGGDCSERFEDCHTPIVGSKLKVLLQMSLILLDASQMKITRIGRLAGQYAKPRSSLVETIDGVTLPAYQGDLVNRPEFTVEARTPDPRNLLTGYQYAALTLNWVRSAIAGNFSQLEYPEYWNLDFAARSPHAEAYKETLRRLTGSVRFMEACAGATMRQIMKFELFTSHEALLLPFEEALSSSAPYREEVYNLGTHFPWIGNRTRALDGAHVEYMRGIGNPVGVKVDGGMSRDEIVQLVQTLNPRNERGKLVLITRFGATKIRAGLPAMIDAIRSAELEVVWMCDPMHGNTVKTNNGLKTRSFDAILSEIRDSFAIHREQGTILGGIHFELTGEDVTECTGGARDLSENDLERAYKSLVDPRLNYEQALEMALQVGALMPKWAGHPPAGPRKRSRTHY